MEIQQMGPDAARAAGSKPEETQTVRGEAEQRWSPHWL